MSETKLFTPREAAQVLGISYPTLKQWIYKKKVRTVQTVGGHHRIPKRKSTSFFIVPMRRRRLRKALRFPPRQRTKSARWPRNGHSDQRPHRAGHALHRWPENHLHYHGRRRARNAPEKRRYRRSSHQIHRSDDSSPLDPNLSLLFIVKINLVLSNRRWA